MMMRRTLYRCTQNNNNNLVRGIIATRQSIRCGTTTSFTPSNNGSNRINYVYKQQQQQQQQQYAFYSTSSSSTGTTEEQEQMLKGTTAEAEAMKQNPLLFLLQQIDYCIHTRNYNQAKELINSGLEMVAKVEYEDEQQQQQQQQEQQQGNQVSSTSKLKEPSWVAFKLTLARQTGMVAFHIGDPEKAMQAADQILQMESLANECGLINDFYHLKNFACSMKVDCLEFLGKPLEALQVHEEWMNTCIRPMVDTTVDSQLKPVLEQQMKNDLFTRGKLNMSLQRYDEALNLFNEYLSRKEGETNVGALYFRAAILVAKGEFDKARADASTLLEQSETPEAQYSVKLLLVQCDISQRRFEGALKLIEEMMSMQPKDPKLFELRAVCNQMTYRFREALADCEVAEKLNSEFSSSLDIFRARRASLLSLAQFDHLMAYQTNFMERAQPDMKPQLKELVAQDKIIHAFWRGDIPTIWNELPNASHLLQFLKFEIVFSLILLQQYERAEQYVDTFATKSKEDPLSQTECAYLKTLISACQGKFEGLHDCDLLLDAQESTMPQEIKEATREYSTRIKLMRGLILSENPETKKEAIQAFRDAIQQATEYNLVRYQPDLYVHLAIALKEVGQVEEAQQYYEKAIAMVPDHLLYSELFKLAST